MIGPLCSQFSVVTYDRRGNSRSPRPEDWHTTSIEEQADDVARLIKAAELEEVRVFGTSWGALIALDVVLRYPDLAHTVVIHEAPLFGVLPDAVEIAEKRRALVEPLVVQGGYDVAFATLVQSNNGNVLNNLDRTLRERLMRNAQLFFELELPAFGHYLPSTESLADSSSLPVVSAGKLSRSSAIHSATAWIAAQMGVDLVELPGGHAPYLDNQPGPRNFGAALATLLTY